MEAKPFIIERTYDAPSLHVWRAITEVEYLQQWYFNVSEFKPEPGFEFRFVSEPCEEANVHLCKVTEVVKGKKISYSWRYEGYEGESMVTFELFEEGKKRTKLVVTHRGLETFPKDIVTKKNFAAGWTYLIGTSLKDLLEKMPA